jgi:hypothetical protein
MSCSVKVRDAENSSPNLIPSMALCLMLVIFSLQFHSFPGYEDASMTIHRKQPLNAPNPWTGNLMPAGATCTWKRSAAIARQIPVKTFIWAYSKGTIASPHSLASLAPNGSDRHQQELRRRQVSPTVMDYK